MPSFPDAGWASPCWRCSLPPRCCSSERVALLRLIQGPFPFGEEDASSRWIFTGLSGWVLAGFAIGLLWVAPIQWLALRGSLPFRRWWLYAGPSLGVAATVVVAAFMCAL